MSRVVLASVFSLLLCRLGRSQEASPELTLRSSTRMVQITVIAQDGKGRPITGLKRDDFTLLDNEKLSEIKVFTFNRKDVAPVAQRAAPVSVTERVFTNAGAERSGPTAITVILLDSLNTKWTDQSRAIRALNHDRMKLPIEARLRRKSQRIGSDRILYGAVDRP